MKNNKLKTKFQTVKKQRKDKMGKRALRTKLCDILGIEHPILSAGMGPTLIGETVAILARKLPERVIAKYQISRPISPVFPLPCVQ
jgi:hypothetical protein